jgi:hypothetical protein
LARRAGSRSSGRHCARASHPSRGVNRRSPRQSVVI